MVAESSLSPSKEHAQQHKALRQNLDEKDGPKSNSKTEKQDQNKRQTDNREKERQDNNKEDNMDRNSQASTKNYRHQRGKEQDTEKKNSKTTGYKINVIDSSTSLPSNIKKTTATDLVVDLRGDDKIEQNKKTVNPGESEIETQHEEVIEDSMGLEQHSKETGISQIADNLENKGNSNKKEQEEKRGRKHSKTFPNGLSEEKACKFAVLLAIAFSISVVVLQYLFRTLKVQ
ncbi:hypothetical protein HAX54_004182 [Datura stramonium]|uniref:Uncharacterized protein n=1 Tax=Datura stramonium TaxID=4076 RepID=A0ABS8T842_DATST|nr:hypothetical protein [Datura stramonium]